MSKKKVLVIGGTGIAGQFITDYLLHYHDICELFIALHIPEHTRSLSGSL